MSRNIKIPVKNHRPILAGIQWYTELTDKKLQVLSNFIDMGEPKLVRPSNQEKGGYKPWSQRPQHVKQLREAVEGQRGNTKDR